MPKVADTPEVYTLPQESAGARVTAPTMNQVDYSGVIPKAQNAFSAYHRGKDDADRAASKAKIQDAVNMYASRVSSWLVQDGGPLRKHQRQVLGKTEDGREFFQGVSDGMEKIAASYVPEFGMSSEEEAEYRRQLVALNKGYWERANAHYAQEKLSYNLGVLSTKADRAALNIQQGGNVVANMATIEGCVRNAFGLKGEAYDNAVIKEHARTIAAQGVQGYIANLIAQGKEGEASLYLAQKTTQGALNAADKIKFRNQVEEALEARATKDSANNTAVTLLSRSTPTGVAHGVFAANGGLPQDFVKATAAQMGVKDFDSLDDRRKEYYAQKATDEVLSHFGGNTKLAFAAFAYMKENNVDWETARSNIDIRMKAAVLDGKPAESAIDGLLVSPAAKGSFTRMYNSYVTKTAYDTPPSVEDCYAEVNRTSPFASEEQKWVRASAAQKLISEAYARRKVVESSTVESYFDGLHQGKAPQDLITINGYSDLPPAVKENLRVITQRFLNGTYDSVGDGAMFEAINTNPTKLSRMTDGEFLQLGRYLNAQQMEILQRQRDALSNGVKMDGKYDTATAKSIIQQMWAHGLGINLEQESQEGKALMGNLLMAVDGPLRRLSLTGKDSYDEMKRTISSTLGTLVVGKGLGPKDGITNLANMQRLSTANQELMAKALQVDPTALANYEGVRAFIDLLYNPSFQLMDQAVVGSQRQRIVEAYKAANGGKVPDEKTILITAMYLNERDKDQLGALYGADQTAKLLKPAPSPSIIDYVTNATNAAGGAYLNGDGFFRQDEPYADKRAADLGVDWINGDGFWNMPSITSPSGK